MISLSQALLPQTLWQSLAASSSFCCSVQLVVPHQIGEPSQSHQTMWPQFLVASGDSSCELFAAATSDSLVSGSRSVGVSAVSTQAAAHNAKMSDAMSFMAAASHGVGSRLARASP